MVWMITSESSPGGMWSLWWSRFSRVVRSGVELAHTWLSAAYR